jgi:carbon monoxide dehydrogenase subunit G
MTRIEERFTVKAGPDAVWAFLIDPARVVTCLPGAELSAVVDERTFDGAVKVKVGPVTVAYKGRVQLVELDRAAWRVRMTGEGRESGGAGSARMSMESRLTPQPDGATEVLVTSDVDVVGRLVQLGRGMIEQVSHQIFLQFADQVRAALEAERAAADGTPLAAGARPARPEAVAALPLLFRALWAWLKALVGLGERRR